MPWDQEQEFCNFPFLELHQKSKESMQPSFLPKINISTCPSSQYGPKPVKLALGTSAIGSIVSLHEQHGG